MSYILDALKKSEQDRGHGNVPGVQTIHSASINYRKDRKPIWPYILIMAVIINIGVIVYFNLEGSSTDKQATTTLKPQPDIMASSTGTPATANTMVYSETLPPRAHVAISQPTASHDRSSQGATSQAITPVNNQTVTTHKGSPSTQTMNTAIPAKQVTEEVSIDTATNTNSARHVEADAASTTSQSNVVYESDDVIDYNELPPAIKAQLPAIIISAHVYSTNPQQRSIVINNNFMEEGEYLIDDIRLIEITREGAVLEYQGYRFRYGSVSSWR